MIDISVNDVAKYYGANKIFEHMDIEIKSRDRMGLVGENGVGKTTLFKILIGQEDYQEGQVHFRKGLKIGYLEQEYQMEPSVTVDEVLQQAFSEVVALEKDLRDLEKNLSEDVSSKEHEQLLKTYGKMQNDFERLGGYEIDYKIDEVARGLDLSDQMRSRPFQLLSGGEKSTVMLGKILLENPDVLLLDEPSNHLDIQSMEWLENYIQGYEGSVFIISHDRYFLDHVASTIVEMKTEGVDLYHGNYSYYVEERQRRFDQAMAVYEQQQKKIKRMEEQIKRFRIWGQMRDSDKMYVRAKELEKRLEKIERIERPKEEREREMSFEGSRTAKEVLSIQGLSMGFDDRLLFTEIEAKIMFSDRVGLIGRNGSGKSTLIKVLMGQLEAKKGNFKFGSRVKIGYLPQEINFENENMTVLTYFQDIFNISESEGRRELSKYHFYGDDVMLKLKNLSGGEKSRLKLGVLMSQKANFLILDEPTNHLDLMSREALEESLIHFEGTILFVSHDRYFIKKMADRVFELTKNHINVFHGNYEYYRLQLQKQQQKIKERPEVKPEKMNTQKENYAQKKENEKKIRQKENRIKRLEQEIEDLEVKQIALENEQMLNGDNYERLHEITIELTQVEDTLLKKLEEWEKCENS